MCVLLLVVVALFVLSWRCLGVLALCVLLCVVVCWFVLVFSEGFLSAVAREEKKGKKGEIEEQDYKVGLCWFVCHES